MNSEVRRRAGAVASTSEVSAPTSLVLAIAPQDAGGSDSAELLARGAKVSLV